MLNGDAHHSLIGEVEPRIWVVADCQRRAILNDKGRNRKQKNSNWATDSQKSVAQLFTLPGDELICQHHGYGNTFNRVGQDWSLSRILIYIYNDGGFAIDAARCSDADAHYGRLEHQIGPMVLEHCGGAFRCLFWKLFHYIFESGDERSSSTTTTTLLSTGSWTTAAAAAREAERTAQRRAEALEHLADRISDSGRAAACKKQAHRIA